MSTEQQNPKTLRLDQLSTQEVLERINDEEATVATVVRGALPAITQAVEAIAAQMRKGGRLIYVGAGTSGRLGVLDAVECVPTYSTPPELVVGLIAGGSAALTRSIENVEDMREKGGEELRDLQVSANDAVVGIAASGRTPYVLGAMAVANEIGAVTIGISCNAPAPLLDAVKIPIAIVTGAEVVTGSTRMKAGSAQKMVLNMISTATMVNLGKVYGNLMVDMQVTNAKLADRARRIVAQVANVDEVEAGQLLEHSGGRVKVAIVMKKLGITAKEAQASITQANGRLRDVIG